jgi:hypothetical protein
VQFVGYAARAAASNSTGKLMPFVVQQNNILLAPVLYAATIYMVLGRVIRQVDGDRYSIIRPTWLTKIFLAGDFVALAIQGSSAGLMVMAQYAELAQGLAIAGLIFHVVVFGLFGATAGIFHKRMLKDPGSASAGIVLAWEQSLYTLYAVSSLVMTRSIFRIIEFVMGPNAYLLTHEWTLYIFDTCLMMGVMGVFWRWYPSTVGKGRRWKQASFMTNRMPTPSVLEMDGIRNK